MGIRKVLQPAEDCDTVNIHLAKACFSMKPEDKRLFCTILKDSKLIKGFSSNILIRVQIEDMKVSGYKRTWFSFHITLLASSCCHKCFAQECFLGLD